MPETKRVIRAVAELDGVSDHMGEVLRRADELLVEWSRFGADVRTQVEREANEAGRTIATAVDAAVVRATSASVERTLTDQIGTKLATLATEMTKLEQRTRAASRAISEQQRGDRRVLWAIAAGILIANVLLVMMLLRRPAQLPPASEPVRVEAPIVAPADAAEPVIVIDAISGAVGSAGSAAGPADRTAAGSASPSVTPVTGKATPPTLGKGIPPAHLPRKR